MKISSCLFFLAAGLGRLAAHECWLQPLTFEPAAGAPVIARIADDRLVLDLRTVFPDEEAALAAALATALR